MALRHRPGLAALVPFAVVAAMLASPAWAEPFDQVEMKMIAPSSNGPVFFANFSVRNLTDHKIEIVGVTCTALNAKGEQLNKSAGFVADIKPHEVGSGVAIMKVSWSAEVQYSCRVELIQ